jgi:hypothetical protein
MSGLTGLGCATGRITVARPIEKGSFMDIEWEEPWDRGEKGDG